MTKTILKNEMYVRCEFCDRSNVEIFQRNEKSIIRKVARPVNDYFLISVFLSFTLRLHKQSQFDISRFVSKIKIVNFDKKLKSVVNFKTCCFSRIYIVGLSTNCVTIHNCHIRIQKSIIRKICQKLLESYPN